MKKLYILMAALLALAFFAIPAMAADDTVTVTVTVNSVASIDFTNGTDTGDSLSVTINSGNVNGQYIMLASDGNLYWETNEGTYKIYAKFSQDWTEADEGMELEVEYASGWLALTTSDQEIRDPSTGTGNYDADVRLNGGTDYFWDVSTTGSPYSGTMTFTLSST